MDLTDTELLHLLRLYLENLPERHLPYCSLAESNYRFHVFAIDPEWEEDIGMEGAANRELEVRLGSRAKGPIVLTERGPGLSSIVDVLAKYLTKFPSSAILKKWVSDLIESAKGAYEEANVPVCAIPSITLLRTSWTNCNFLPTTKVIKTFDDPDYISSDEDADTRSGGARTLQLLLKISKPCRLAAENGTGVQKLVRCLASKGCHKNWVWPRNRQRILVHAKTCDYLPDNLRREALEHIASNGSAQSLSGPLVPPTSQVPTEKAIKRQKTGPTTERQIGKEMDAFLTKGKKQWKGHVDKALMKFAVCAGIPPTVFDAAEFKELASILNSSWNPPSSSTITGRLIPEEAAEISVSIRKHLQECRNLTITFDGGKIRRPKAIYTIHVTTPERRTFCMAIDDGSRLSHSATYIVEALERVGLSY
ncbi:hypothetical protein EV363DRAFT_1199666 [Boletus edulis]|nr:hypothetical protein EV363DRAFT_1199666 [Boletus edulis]